MLYFEIFEEKLKKKRVTTDHRTFEEKIIYDFYDAVRYVCSPSLKLGLFGRKDGYVYVVTLKCDQTAFCHSGFFDVVSRLFWCGLPSEALQERSVRSRTLPHMFIISPLFYWWPQNLRKRKKKQRNNLWLFENVVWTLPYR